MDDITYYHFLQLLICSDPWPIAPTDPGGPGYIELTDFANAEAVKRGYDGWITALHRMRLH